jgi:hypothetical protein
MEQQINYEAEVKRVYPEAKVEYVSFGYSFIVNGKKGLSVARPIESLAWQSAYENLKKQGKL